MIIKHARDVALQWVTEQAARAQGFRGAYHAGSVNWSSPEATLPPTSDVDVTVVLAGPEVPGKPGILLYRGVLLDVSYAPIQQFRSPDLVLGDYHLAGTFSTPNIILDPTGQLTQLQRAVSKDYARRHWVHRRCEQAAQKVLSYAASLSETAPLHDQVVPWLFATGITTHVLLVAGLRSPTVRRRYLAVRRLLEEYGRLDFYGTLLQALGCADMSRARVELHLAALVEAFDAAKAVVKTPFFFASEISDIARPLSVDGSLDLIERGYHREAVFGIVATYSRCRTILYHDAPPEMHDSFSAGYLELLGDLGINSFSDLQQRSNRLKALLPRVQEVAGYIMAANPGIKD